METLINMIRPELLIVAVVLYLIGFGLKKWNKIKDNYIPLILTAIGIIACFLYLGIVDGFVWQTIVSGLIQGILCAAASVYVNQVIKQLREAKVVDEKVVDVLENIVEKTEDNKKEK